MNDSYQNWEDFFRSQVESDLVWCLDNSPNFLKFHTIDRTLILFLRFVLGHKKNGLAVYPINKMNITTSLAAEALFQRVAFKERKKILLIGKNIAIREAFRTLTNANGQPLEQIFPIGVVKYDGRVFNQSKIKYNKKLLTPKIIFSSSPNILPDFDYGKDIYLILVEVDSNTPFDFRHTLEKYKKKNGIPCIFWITSNPYISQTRELLFSNIPYWGWNSHELSFDFKKELENNQIIDYKKNPFSAPIYNIKNAAEGITKIIVPVEDEILNDMLINAKKKYLNLVDDANKINNSKYKKMAKNYIKIVHAFEELTAPLGFSEKEFSVTWGIIPINIKLEYVKKQAEELRNEDYSLNHLMSAIDELDNIYKYFETTQLGKPSLLTKIINISIREKKKTAIITKNEASKRALINYLSFSNKWPEVYLNNNGILIESANNADDIPDIDTCIVYGNPGYYNKKILRCSCCKNIGFLAYASEARALEYLIKNEINEQDKFFSYARRTESVSKIMDIPVNKFENLIFKPPKITYKKDQIIYIKPQDKPDNELKIDSFSDNILDLDLSIGSDFNDIESSLFVQLGPENNKLNYKVITNLIKLSSGKCIYIPFQKRTPIFIDNKNEVKYKKCEKLAKDDLLILINNGLRKSIAQEILDTVDKLPKMVDVVTYQRSWIETLHRGMKEHNHSIKDVFDLLKEHGSNIETQVAVYFWASGEVLGPNRKNKENIKFIGEIYQDPFLIQNFEKIYKSIERLRKIHIRLKRNLGQLMINAGIMIKKNIEDQIIDEELNLFLEDFSNSINIEKICSIEGPFEIKIGDCEIVFNC